MLEIIFFVGMSVIYATLLTALADATDFIYIPGGSYPIESSVSPLPDRTDPTRSRFVESFLICTHPVTQAEYETTMHANSGIASDGDAPAQGISWRDVTAYCNARSKAEGLTPAYVVTDRSVIWDRIADGYRLLTKAEWMYACQSGEPSVLSSGPTDCHGRLSEWVWEPDEETGAAADKNSKEELAGKLRIICMEPPHAANIQQQDQAARPICFRLARSAETLMGTVSL